MKKAIWLLLAVAVAAAGLYYWNTDDMQDRRAWRRFAAELTEANVTKIEFGGAKLTTLTEADRREVLALLKAAKFDRSNRVGHGPTPQAVIRITFKEGQTVNVGLWSMTTFEVSLPPDSQFLIASEQLGIWLKNRFTGPTIGAGGQNAPAPFF